MTDRNARRNAVANTALRHIEDIKRRDSLARQAQQDSCLSLGQLFLWNAQYRLIPNEFLRCPLFAATNRSRKRMLYERHLIPQPANSRFELRYTGPQLNQLDLTLLLECLHQVRGHVLGKPIAVNARQLLISMQKTISGERYRTLARGISRLGAARLDLRFKGSDREIGFNLLGDTNFKLRQLSEWRHSLTILFSPHWLELFKGGNYSVIHWPDWMCIPHGLCSWLYGYFVSHRKPYPFIPKTIWHYSGSCQDETSYQVTSRLGQSLDKLNEIGFLSSYTIVGEKLVVARKNRGQNTGVFDRQPM